MLGKLLYKFYHTPKGYLNDLYTRYSPSRKRIEAAKLSMEAAASTLFEIHQIAPESTLNVNFLTGQKFWYQSIFCLNSLQKVCVDTQVTASFYDDGSLTNNIKDFISGHFPNSNIVSKETIEDRLDQYLPSDKYPCLRKLRKVYPHLKKITDIHAGQPGQKITLDSDMLFFKCPSEIIAWYQQPFGAIAMQESKQSYGYPQSFLEHLTCSAVPLFINVGITGIQSQDIDWEEVEYWTKQLTNKRISYYLEQALTAMIFSKIKLKKLSTEKYIVLTSSKDASKANGNLHHYVAGSKPFYFSKAWKTLN